MGSSPTPASSTFARLMRRMRASSGTSATFLPTMRHTRAAMLASTVSRADQRPSVAIGLAIGLFGFGLPGQAKLLVAAAIAFSLALRQREAGR